MERAQAMSDIIDSYIIAITYYIKLYFGKLNSSVCLQSDKAMTWSHCAPSH